MSTISIFRYRSHLSFSRHASQVSSQVSWQARALLAQVV
jgi:hypothetical protein